MYVVLDSRPPGLRLRLSSNCHSSSDVHNLFKSFPKFGIEDRVDDRINEAIHITQPSGQYENSHSRAAVRLQFCANGVHDIAREERYPTDKEDTWWEGE